MHCLPSWFSAWLFPFLPTQVIHTIKCINDIEDSTVIVEMELKQLIRAMSGSSSIPLLNKTVTFTVRHMEPLKIETGHALFDPINVTL